MTGSRKIVDSLPHPAHDCLDATAEGGTMAEQPQTGPLTVVDLPDGTKAPFYVVPFDAEGACSGPRAAGDAVADAARATDVFLRRPGRTSRCWSASSGRARRWCPRTGRLRRSRPTRD